MKYAVAYKLVTEAKRSVDGKKHTHILYFGGLEEIRGFGYASQWLTRKEAVWFDTKAEANRIAKKYKNDGCFIVSKKG